MKSQSLQPKQELTILVQPGLQVGPSLNQRFVRHFDSFPVVVVTACDQQAGFSQPVDKWPGHPAQVIQKDALARILQTLTREGDSNQTSEDPPYGCPLVRIEFRQFGACATAHGSSQASERLVGGMSHRTRLPLRP